MTTQQLADAIKTLKDHNEWRRGVEGYEMCDPATLGRAIDLVCEAAQAHEAANVGDDELRGKIEAEVLAECQFHGAFDAKRIAKDVAPKIAAIITAAQSKVETVTVGDLKAMAHDWDFHDGNLFEALAKRYPKGLRIVKGGG